MRLSRVLVGLLALGLCACSILPPPADSPISGKSGEQADKGSWWRSGAPTPSRHPVYAQLELQSASHWDGLAREVAARIARERAKNQAGNKPLFVEPLDPEMPFAKAFHGYLVGHLLGRGQRVGLTRAGADRLRFTVQPIHHEIGDYTPPPGAVTLLAGGGLLAWKYNHALQRFVVAALAGETLLATAYGKLDALSEVVISISLLRGERILSKMSATYYVDESELSQYVPRRPPPPLIVRDSGAGREAMPVRAFAVVSHED